MAKQTTYSDIRNVLLVVSFNQPADGMGGQLHPVVIEARGDAITAEGAVLSVTEKTTIGDTVETPLSHEELYKQVYGISPILAQALSNVLQTGVAQDMSAVDVSGVPTLTLADIAVADQPVREEQP